VPRRARSDDNDLGVHFFAFLDSSGHGGMVLEERNRGKKRKSPGGETAEVRKRQDGDALTSARGRE